MPDQFPSVPELRYRVSVCTPAPLLDMLAAEGVGEGDVVLMRPDGTIGFGKTASTELARKLRPLLLALTPDSFGPSRPGRSMQHPRQDRRASGE